MACRECASSAISWRQGNSLSSLLLQGGKLTEACDLWSLGVTLFMLLKNALPFHLPKGAPNTFWSNVIGNPNEVRSPPSLGCTRLRAPLLRGEAVHAKRFSNSLSAAMRCDAIRHKNKNPHVAPTPFFRFFCLEGDQEK